MPPDPSLTNEQQLTALLEQYISLSEGGQLQPNVDDLCQSSPELRGPLAALVARYQELLLCLTPAPDAGSSSEAPPQAAALPEFEGFRTIERLGRGGAGDVYRLLDLALGREVAAKVLRADSPLAARADALLHEARALALFDDPRIVRLLELRHGQPTLLLMEYVDGFTLADLGRALTAAQQARVLLDVAEAIDGAHRLGIQHRDLKPGNILLDAQLRPRILDFGLAAADAEAGLGMGTLPYMAPERLDPSRGIDQRADVYALGVILYELLCGERPYDGTTDEGLIEAIRSGTPRLPVELQPAVAEPLQAIALKALERDVKDRYASAADLAADLRRFIEGRPVAARPTLYATVLERMVQPQLQQIAEWQRLRLIYPHEAERLRRAYRPLEAREDDWIVASRVLSFSQIALYLGVFLSLLGGVFYFSAYRSDNGLEPWRALLGLGLPIATLSASARALFRGGSKAVAVAFAFASVVLLPPLLLVLMREGGVLSSPGLAERALFSTVTNGQLQVAGLVTALWTFILASRTRTVALSSAFVALVVATYVTFLADQGLRPWIDEERWDALALHLLPLAFALGPLGWTLERDRLGHLVEPLYFSSAVLGVLALELLALEGKAMELVGLTLSGWARGEISDPRLLDTVAVMTVIGLLVYLSATLMDARGTALMKRPARLLVSVSPFAALEPLAYLVQTAEYARGLDWTYLVLAVATALQSRYRQRLSFFMAGLGNTAVALYLIADHNDWLDRPGWGIFVVGAACLALLVGFACHWSDRRRSAFGDPDR